MKGDICATCKKAQCVSDDDCDANLAELSGWIFDARKKAITKTFEFKTFPEAVDFVSRVADIAEEEEHHPDIDIRYTKVTLALSTHDLGCISDRDFSVAQKIAIVEHI